MEDTPKSQRIQNHHYRSRSYTPGASERKGRRDSLPKVEKKAH